MQEHALRLAPGVVVPVLRTLRTGTSEPRARLRRVVKRIREAKARHASGEVLAVQARATGARTCPARPHRPAMTAFAGAMGPALERDNRDALETLDT